MFLNFKRNRMIANHKRENHEKNKQVKLLFHTFPYRDGDPLPWEEGGGPSQFWDLRRWFHVNTAVIPNFHYPQRVSGDAACGLCEGIGRIMRLNKGHMEEIGCHFCQGTGNHQVWVDHERSRFAQYSLEQSNLARGRNRDGSRRVPLRRTENSYPCPLCEGKGRGYTYESDSKTYWNGQGFETHNYGQKKSWGRCNQCEGRGWLNPQI